MGLARDTVNFGKVTFTRFKKELWKKLTELHSYRFNFQGVEEAEHGELLGVARGFYEELWDEGKRIDSERAVLNAQEVEVALKYEQYKRELEKVRRELSDNYGRGKRNDEKLTWLWRKFGDLVQGGVMEKVKGGMGGAGTLERG